VTVNNKQLIKKLQNAYQVCRDCGLKYGVYSVGCSSVWEGVCNVCDETKPITEARDYGYLVTGIRKLIKEDETKAKIKKQSKEVAEYMKETEDKTKYRSSITQVCVHREDGFRTLQTTVSLTDEGGGEFITLMDNDGNDIRLDFEEFDEIIKAVALLKNQ
jgi:hypothetical protein